MSSVLEQPPRETPAMPEAAPARENGTPGLRDVPTLLLLALSFVLFLALAWPRLIGWMEIYRQADSYYVYGPAIPALTGLMLWHRRVALRAAPKRPFWGALGLLLPSLALTVVALKNDMASAVSLSILLILWSSFWLVLGTRWVCAAAFPLGFLLWMAPLPGPILHDGTYGCQQLSTVLADKTLHLLTFPTTLSGNMITMDDFLLFVDLPCSGMKLLLTMLMAASAFAWLLDGPALRRLGLFLLALPLSIAVNVLRIVILGVVGECIGTQAEHSIHDISGMIVVDLGLLLLFLIARRIGCRTFAGWPLF